MSTHEPVRKGDVVNHAKNPDTLVCAAEFLELGGKTYYLSEWPCRQHLEREIERYRGWLEHLQRVLAYHDGMSFVFNVPDPAEFIPPMIRSALDGAPAPVPVLDTLEEPIEAQA